MFTITVVTLFPDMFPGPLGFGLSGRALGELWDINLIGIREFATDKYRTVDDSPYGGGAGMVMKPDVVHDAMTAALKPYNNTPQIFFMSPRGQTFNQQISSRIMDSNNDGMIFLCGRYEGIDQRVIDHWKKEHGMQEISIGNYILFGGELAAMVVIDSCLRQIGGIMNNEESIEYESFSIDLLEYPQYTRPAIWNGDSVPSVLLSGNHGEIAKWRRDQAIQITKEVQPDLYRRFIDGTSG